MTKKRSAKDRTAAEWKSVAKATRHRRRILQAGFFFRIFAKKKCVACPRKSSLYDKVRAFFVQKREELKQNGRK